MPAVLRPAISARYVVPCSRAAALMRTIHRRRKSRFFLRRPTKAYLFAVSADSFAARYSLLLLANMPFVRASSFFRLARRTFPRFTLGIANSLKSPWVYGAMGPFGVHGFSPMDRWTHTPMDLYL